MPVTSFSATNRFDLVGSQVVTGGLAVGTSSEVNYGLTIQSTPKDSLFSTSLSVSASTIYVAGINVAASTSAITTAQTSLTVSAMHVNSFKPTSISALASGMTVTNAATEHILGVPTKTGVTSNLVLTNAYGMFVDTSVTNATNAYGVYVNAPTGATNNYALYVGSGSSSLGNITGGAWLATAVGVNYGGTGQTATPSNGQLLIGTGSGFQLTTLTAGTNVTITNSSGSITINASGSGGGASLSVANTWTAGQTFSGGLTISAATTDVYATLTNTASGGRSWIINATSTGSGEGSGRLLFKDATASATRMTIDSSGNVGIGTIGPGSALDVKGTLRLSGSTSGYVGFAPAAAAGSITYTLPSADGASSQVLQTSGGGILSWATPRRVYSIPASAFTVTATNPATFQAVGTSNASSGQSNVSGGAFYELSFPDTSTSTSADVVLRASAHALDGTQTMSVKLVWYSSAITGAVRWAWDIYSGTTSNVANGALALIAATTATVNATTLRHNITTLTTLVGSNVPLEDSLVTLRISRLGADGADTLIATANVIAVYVEFT